MTTVIELRQMIFHAYHGVLPQEHQVGGTYTVDLRLHGDFGKACRSDDLAGTIDYGAVCLAVKEEMTEPSALIEHVAFRIARRLFSEFAPLRTVEVQVCKQCPPVPGVEVQEACLHAAFDRHDTE